MLTLLIIWVALGGAMMLIGSGRLPTAGLPLAYFLGLSLIHVPGAAVYLNFPEWDALTLRTLIGFQETVIGMTAFLVGVMLARIIRGNSRHDKCEPVDPKRISSISFVYLVLGVCYFIAGSLVRIPSVGAIIASLSSLLIVGICLRLWLASEQRKPVMFWITASLLPLLPVITVLKDGFIGFGTYWMLAAMSFAFGQSKRRMLYFILAPFVVYLGLSVFINYMASRTAFRQAVWYQQVGLGDRVDRVVHMFQNFEWLDGDNPKQRKVIDGRLNQNLLVGAAVERLQTGKVNFAHGNTIVVMAIGLIPRALWPDKPQVGGGGTVVREFTGIRFLDGTSVGAGQVLEFYANFATIGVIGGFLVYGWLIGWMDLRIMQAIQKNQQREFLTWFMVCLALLQPGGNLLEIAASVAGSAITATGLSVAINAYCARFRSRGTQLANLTAA